MVVPFNVRVVASPRRTGSSALPPSLSSAQENRLLRRPRHLIALGFLGLAITALLAFGAGIATTEPAAIEAKRAELARIQGELDGINTQVEAAAEAYNGARYQLGQVTDRIDENTRVTRQTEKDLKASRAILAQRLRNLYATPEPSLAEVLITSGSISAAADEMSLLDRVGRQDASVVGGLREHKARLVELRKQLEEDKATATRAVTQREAQKERVENLLAQRQEVLDNASTELKQMIAAEKERERREAAAAAALARQRQAATANATVSGNTPGEAPVAGAVTPSTPLPSGSGNAAAASIAMQYLGVPYVWGGASPERLRLQRPGVLRLRADRQERSPLHGRHLGRLPQGAVGSAPARRHGLLPRPRAHGDLHRRRPVRARPAHRRRRQGEQPRDVLRLRRSRPPLAVPAGRRLKGRRSAGRHRRGWLVVSPCPAGACSPGPCIATGLAALALAAAPAGAVTSVELDRARAKIDRTSAELARARTAAERLGFDERGDLERLERRLQAQKEQLLRLESGLEARDAQEQAAEDAAAPGHARGARGGR